MKRIVNIVGARPNFIKIAPIHALMRRMDEFDPQLIHTGQHYDDRMSKTFFDDLGLPRPDLYLGVGPGSHARQTAAVMVELEKALLELQPDRVVVVGDVNSTLAAALAAAKLNIPVAHVEAGLRSNDRTMPEEINRILTDAVSDLLFVSERSGMRNLAREGVDAARIHLVGNVMIDSLIGHLKKADGSNILSRLSLDAGAFALMTLHRPANVDDPQVLEGILDAIAAITERIPMIFPIHPRTRKNLTRFGCSARIDSMSNLILLEPLGYLDFLHLMARTRLVLTDSGGIQEETTYLGIPCLTLRENTERPVTLELGTNQLVGLDPDRILNAAINLLDGEPLTGRVPEKWDGNTAQRIVKILADS